MPGGPATVIAVPLFNQAAHVREAIDSLLAQTDRDLAIILIDDCSSDGTSEIAETLAAADDRVIYLRNERRLGLACNWRRCYEVSRSRFPEARFFAWGSDHDRWHPAWLETLSAALVERPAAALAYPRFARIDSEGVERSRRFVPFSTCGVRSPLRRFALTLVGAPSGRLVYGLYRTDLLERTSGFRAVLAPDRLLLLELSLNGDFIQVPELLWARRFRHRTSAGRQRRATFPDGAPLWSFAPWWLQHPVCLAWRATAREQIPSAASRSLSTAAALFVPLVAVRTVLRSATWTRTRLRRRARSVRAAASTRVRAWRNR